MLKRALRLADRLRRERRQSQIEFSSGLGEAAYALYGLVRALNPQICVETGSARGKSTCFIAKALKDNGHGRLYAIDPHEETAWNDNNSILTLDILKANLDTFGVSDYVEIVRARTGDLKGWNRPIDFLFIDGDHSYQGVKQDWELFSPHVRQFGLVAFHDTLWDLYTDRRPRNDIGVPSFLDELRCQGYPVITFGALPGISLLQAKKGGVPLTLDGGGDSLSQGKDTP